MGVDYSIYNFCSRCQKRVIKNDSILNAIGGVVCPICHHRMRTNSFHSNRRSQAKVKVFEYPDLLNGVEKR
jgi:DNA-directed RNA polymerase subunit RPC12/RpoP